MNHICFPPTIKLVNCWSPKDLKRPWWNLVEIRLCKEIWIFVPFSKATENHVLLCISFILIWKQKVCWQPRAMFCLYTLCSASQNSNVDNILPDLNKIPPRPFYILWTLHDLFIYLFLHFFRLSMESRKPFVVDVAAIQLEMAQGAEMANGGFPRTPPAMERKSHIWT